MTRGCRRDIARKRKLAARARGREYVRKMRRAAWVKAWLETSLRFEFKPRAEDLEFQIPFHARIGSLKLRRPIKIIGST